MNPSPSGVRRLFAPLFAVLVVAALYFFSADPGLAEAEESQLAARFRFERYALADLPGLSYDRKVRPVHPSLKHVASMISFVGAAAALADLDGDGLPNDLILIDPRVDRVTVSPAPGTGDRYATFVLDPSPLPFDATKMCPMGCLVGDFDEDGWPDVLVCYWGRSPVLFMQRPGPSVVTPVSLSRACFEPRELVEPAQPWFTSAVALADLDGDGHLDLIVGNYHRDGAGIFDANGTGVEQMPASLARAFNGGGNRLLLWTGSQGKFTGFREGQGVLDGINGGWTFGIGAADLDGDLLPEIYFVEDFGPDRMLHNRSRPGKLSFGLLLGERTFTTPRSKAVGRDSFNGMGIDFADYNGDGVLDIFVSNITAKYGLFESSFAFLSDKKSLHRMRDGVAPFRDASEELGLSRGGWNWEIRVADFDNDGSFEVAQAAGYTKGPVSRWPELQEVALGNDGLVVFPHVWNRTTPEDDIAGNDHNRFFVRARNGRYYDISQRLGEYGKPMCSRAIAPADVDGDGRLDFVLANNWEPSFFFRNKADKPGEFLGLHLCLPVNGNAGATAAHPGHPERKKHGLTRPAIGASATVRLPGEKVLAAQVDGGTGHMGKRAPHLHFGLGEVDRDKALDVDLRWRGPDGRIHSQTLSLKPGWHTVILGDSPEANAGDEQ